jgi:fatty acid desaturase
VAEVDPVIPAKRIDPSVLAARARRQKRLQAATWLLSVALLLAALMVPFAPWVAAWWIIAAVAVAILAIQILSLRRLAPHHDAANPPDPLEGRKQKTVDFDKTWRQS